MAFVLPLSGDNFTAPSRTPWGGGRLASWKRALGYAAEPPLGESWEISFGPELASKLRGEDTSLVDALKRQPSFAGPAPPSLLVKLLDAGAPLSVQIHPRDDDPALAPDESGKPECWYVAEADPGAVIHVGLTEDATPEAMRAAIAGGENVSLLLRRIEVQTGDFFVVPPGTPHAIGAGVTVVEPQRVVPGKRGVTYRYWDWNRRYDSAGRLDSEGAPRALHVEDALRVTNWDEREVPWRRAGLGATDAAPVLTPLSGPAGIAFPVEVARLTGTGAHALEAAASLRGVTVVAGELAVDGARARRGESLLLAVGRPFEVTCHGVVAVLSRISGR